MQTAPKHKLATGKNSKKEVTSNFSFGSLSRRIPIFRSLFLRENPAGGKLIALIGVDGSGKSTISKELHKWLSYNKDARLCYMGTGYKVTILSQVLRFFSRISDKSYKASSKFFGQENTISRIFGDIHRFTWYLRYLSYARTRYRRYASSVKNVSHGSIIICDRYPLSMIHRVMKNAAFPPMDGPRIAWMVKGKKINGITAYLCRKEQEIYKNILPPDFVVALHVSPTIALKRKNDLSRKEAEAKITAIETMDHSDLNIIHINADQSLDQTISRIKSALLNIL